MAIKYWDGQGTRQEGSQIMHVFHRDTENYSLLLPGAVRALRNGVVLIEAKRVLQNYTLEPHKDLQFLSMREQRL